MSYNYQDAPRESQQEYFGKKTKRVVDLENQVRFMGMQIDNLKAICRTDNTETLQNALKRIEELEQKIEKMKCCDNCKYNSYWGNELHCNYGLKEALQEDRLVECNKMDKWEIKND